FLRSVRDEAYALGIRYGVRKRLRKRAVAGEFQNAELPKLIRAEIFSEVIQPFLRRFDHPRDVVFVPAVVVDLDVYVVPFITLDLVPAGDERVEIGDLRLTHIVAEISQSILGPLALQITRRDRDLIGRSADHAFKMDPVGVLREEISVSRLRVFRRGHIWRRLQPLVATLVIIAQLVLLAVTNGRKIIPV